MEESLIVQRLILKKYAEENGIEFVENYVDIHKHTVEDRPAYNRLIKDIFEGKIDMLVVIGGTDRLTRKMEILEKIMQCVKMEFIFTKLEYEKLKS